MMTPRAVRSRAHESAGHVIVVGGGVAGLATTLGLRDCRVTLLTKSRLLTGGASPRAQGGIAAAVGRDDSPALHARDTIRAGAGLCVPGIVETLTCEGPAQVRRLIEAGARFDRAESGRLATGREAAHSRPRILHANGDATGAEIVRALTAAVRSAPHVRASEETLVEDVVLERGRAVGVVTRAGDGTRTRLAADAIVLATGGIGAVFLRTTNPREATGDGLAIAARAGAVLTDLEFVQFHPTALDVGADPLPLLTEALRGQEAWLVDERGHRFVFDVHPDGELAPRDVVARAIWMHAEAGHRVFLDARAAIGEAFPCRFPTVFDLCRAHGVDPCREPMPVTPAAHYFMGGVATDARGRTSLGGLWACGEVACTGVHGANRLASNSLLEGLVFGARVAEDVAAVLRARARETRSSAGAPRRLPAAADRSPAGEVLELVRQQMWQHVGLVRSASGLEAALERFARLARELPADAGQELRNVLLVARMVATAALDRRESRGAHCRSDFPESRPEWRRRLSYRLAADGRLQPCPSHGPFEHPDAGERLPLLESPCVNASRERQTAAPAAAGDSRARTSSIGGTVA